MYWARIKRQSHRAEFSRWKHMTCENQNADRIFQKWIVSCVIVRPHLFSFTGADSVHIGGARLSYSNHNFKPIATGDPPPSSITPLLNHRQRFLPFLSQLPSVWIVACGEGSRWPSGRRRIMCCRCATPRLAVIIIVTFRRTEYGGTFCGDISCRRERRGVQVEK